MKYLRELDRVPSSLESGLGNLTTDNKIIFEQACFIISFFTKYALIILHIDLYLSKRFCCCLINTAICYNSLPFEFLCISKGVWVQMEYILKLQWTFMFVDACGTSLYDSVHAFSRNLWNGIVDILCGGPRVSFQCASSESTWDLFCSHNMCTLSLSQQARAF